MGDDLSTYRIRIGRFFSRTRTKTNNSPRFHCLALYIQTWCPDAKLLLMCLCVAQLLICAGDVETNPGPDKLDQILAAVKESVESNKQYQKETTDKLNEINAGTSDINSRVAKLEESINEIAKLKEDIVAVNAAIREVRTEVNTISRRQRESELLSDELNNRMRRNNLIIKGLPENERENWSDSERIVRAFLSSNLQVNVGEIERAHRLGMRKPDFNRPIIVKFLNFKCKDEVLKNAHKLRNAACPGVWIEEDFSPKMQLVRKKLRDFAELRFGASKFRLYYDKVLINNTFFRYDSDSDSVVESPRALPTETSA
ncbi:unnamed protein product [Ixodes hexagonus]